MTTFIMGHGEYRPKDTFVPSGAKIGVYAEPDEILAITLGMAVLAKPGGYPARTTTAGGEPIHNYRVDPLTPPELAMMKAVASPANKVFYIGHCPEYPEPTILCDGDEHRCKDGVHRCAGILGKVDDPDIRLAFCLVPAALAGLAAMTTAFPKGAEYQEITKQLAAYRETAVQWLAKVEKAPAQRIAEFRRFQEARGTAAEAAFVLASSAKLQDLLVLDQARTQWASITAWEFLEAMNTLPEGRRLLVREDFREKGAGNRFAGEPAEASRGQKFVESFFLATTDQRYDAWLALTQPEQDVVGRNGLVATWHQQIVPFVQRYRAGLAAKEPALACFAAVGAKAATEVQQMEAEDCAAYKVLMNGCIAFVTLKTTAEKNSLWDALADSAEGREALFRLNGKGPGKWAVESGESPVPDAATRWRAWLEEYAAAGEHLRAKPEKAVTEPARETALPEPEPEPEPEVVPDLGLNEFADFWDDADSENQRDSRRWEEGSVIHVVAWDGMLRFLPERPADLALAFPQAPWSTFKVKSFGFPHNYTFEGGGAVDLEALRAYFARVSFAAVTFL